MSLVAGIDIGSKNTKAVILDAERRVVGRAQARTRPDFAGVARQVLETAAGLAGVHLSDVTYVATTGFGRYNVPFRDLQITEITCAARGAAFLFPKTRCVLDVGALSTRAIKLRPACFDGEYPVPFPDEMIAQLGLFD